MRLYPVPAPTRSGLLSGPQPRESVSRERGARAPTPQFALSLPSLLCDLCVSKNSPNHQLPPLAVSWRRIQKLFCHRTENPTGLGKRWDFPIHHIPSKLLVADLENFSWILLQMPPSFP